MTFHKRHIHLYIYNENNNNSTYNSKEDWGRGEILIKVASFLIDMKIFLCLDGCINGD